MSVHDGHRERTKERFRKEGLDHFDELHVLELLLYYGVPRRDTNLMAHQLLDQFGSLSQVLEAPAEELEKVSGVTKNVSTLLNLIPALSRYYVVNRGTQSRSLTTTKECGEYLMPYFVGRNTETVFLLCLDAKCKVLGCKEISEGNVNTAGVSIRRMVEVALNSNATSVILAHNHPSGIAVPSTEDIITTRRAAVALDAVGVTLADHVVIADDDFVSLADSGLYRPEDHQLMV